MEEFFWETPRISSARGLPAHGSVLQAQGWWQGSFGRRFWEKLCFPQPTSEACYAAVAPDCILKLELIRFPRGKEGCLIVKFPQLKKYLSIIRSDGSDYTGIKARLHFITRLSVRDLIYFFSPPKKSM